MASRKPNHLRPTNVDAPWAHEFWQALGSRKLLARRCGSCNVRHFPPKPRCPECMGDNLEWIELSGRGTLHSWTRVRVAGPEFETPFVLGLVDLEGGIGRLAAKIVDDDQPLEVGMPVRITYLDLGDGFSLYGIAVET